MATASSTIDGVERHGNAYCKFVTCPRCKRQRWASLKPDGTVRTMYCRSCNYSMKRPSVLAVCSKCGNERFTRPENATRLCRKCAMRKGEQSWMWKGGRVKTACGYIKVRVFQDNPYYSMGDKVHYVAEHRLVIAKHLNRCLGLSEVVHHKNGIKDDNRLKNLELSDNRNHITQHNKGYQDGYRHGYEDGADSKIGELRKEIKLLQWQMSQIGGNHVL